MVSLISNKWNIFLKSKWGLDGFDYRLCHLLCNHEQETSFVPECPHTSIWWNNTSGFSSHETFYIHTHTRTHFCETMNIISLEFFKLIFLFLSFSRSSNLLLELNSEIKTSGFIWIKVLSTITFGEIFQNYNFNCHIHQLTIFFNIIFLFCSDSKWSVGLGMSTSLAYMKFHVWFPNCGSACLQSKHFGGWRQEFQRLRVTLSFILSLSLAWGTWGETLSQKKWF